MSLRITRATLRRRAPVLLALVVVACDMGDCEKPLSESARRGDAQVLSRVTHDQEFDVALPAIVHRDTATAKTVRIIADTMRFFPARHAYQRKVVFGVVAGDGPELRVPQVAPWTEHTMYEVASGFDRYVVLDSFEVAPGLDAGKAFWRGSGELGLVSVFPADGDTTTHGREMYRGSWVPARKR